MAALKPFSSVIPLVGQPAVEEHAPLGRFEVNRKGGLAPRLGKNPTLSIPPKKIPNPPRTTVFGVAEYENPKRGEKFRFCAVASELLPVYTTGTLFAASALSSVAGNVYSWA